MLTKETWIQVAEDTENFLNQARTIKGQLETVNNQIANLNNVRASITSTLKDVVAFTGPSSKIESCTCEIDSLLPELKSRADFYAQKYREIEYVINNLVSKEHWQNLLKKYYFSGHDWDFVAEDMGYSVRWCFRIRNKAIEEISEKARKILEKV